MKTAQKHTTDQVLIWACLLDSTKDIWVAYSLLADSKKITCKGERVVGCNNAYNSLTDALNKSIENLDDSCLED